MASRLPRLLPLAGFSLWALALIGGTATGQTNNPIVVENQQPGTLQWQIPIGSSATDSGGQIKGYASTVSVNKGANITFYVSVAPAQTYSIDIYRMGWYQGLGGRLMQRIGPLSGIQQATCPADATTGLIECLWTPSYVLATQTSWTDGIYVARLTNAQGFQNYIIFAVRDDNRIASFYYQQPVDTYQAYNNYPNDGKTGKSLYAFNSFGATTVSGGRNAVKVSFDRPYEGNGTDSSYNQTFFQWEFELVRWMEKSGYDVTYGTDVDTHANPGRLLNFKGVVVPGHSEYWSKSMFDGFFAARDAGVNLAFFGGNPTEWQNRFESSSTGNANRVVVCYRSTTKDPVVDRSQVTVEWRNPALSRPEQTLVGVQYTDQVPYTAPGYATYVVTNSSNWVYAGTGFQEGDRVPHIVGYEADRLFNQYPLPNSVPGSYTLLSQSPLGNGGANDFSNSSIYQALSGAWVFAAGTMSWSWALDDYLGLGFVDPRIQLTTATVLNAFLNPPNNFSIVTAPATQTVLAGGATSYSVTVSLTPGFTGQVSLSVNGLPDGATGSFSPNTTAGASTLTVGTTANTPPGPYTLTITGTGGALTHTAVVGLTVSPPGVKFDTAVSSGYQWGVTRITTPTLVVGSAANRAAMIMVAMAANTASNVTASLGGVSGTVVAGTDTGTAATKRTLIFCVANPPSGAQTATVSWTTSMNADVGVMTVSGANQTTPCTNGTFFATNSSATLNSSVTITSNPGDLTASVATTTAAWVSPFTNQTLKWGVDSSSVGGDVGPGTGSTTHTWIGQYFGTGRTLSGANFKAF